MSNPVKFEQAFQRLETILEEMNSSSVELENALTLFEEADKLIETCQTKLKDAEQKVELLIKKRADATEVETAPFEA